MNVIAGIVIGYISTSWFFSIIAPFVWGAIHCIYGYVLGLHKNIIVESTKGGNPILSYYIASYFTGTITSLIFSIISYSILKFVI